MRTMLAIAWLQLRLTFQSPGRLVMMFVLPLAFIGVLGLATGTGHGAKPLTLAVVDADGSFAAGRLVAALQADGGLKVRPAEGGQMDRLLADHGAAAGLIIPAGYERGLAGGSAAELQLVTVPGSNPQQSVRPAVARAADAVAASYRTALRLARDPAAVPAAYAKAAADRPEIVVEQADAGADGAGNPDLAERTVGFTVMFVMMMVLMQGGMLRQERESGTWGRILTAPASRVAVLGGYLASMVMTGVVQFVGLVLISRLLFHVHWGAPLPLAAMVAATVLSAAGLGVFLAAVMRTAEQQRLVAMLVATVSGMLGGVYSSLDLLSATMQKVGHLTLQAWAMDGLRAVVFRGGHWSALAVPAGVLTAATLAFMVGGLWRLQRE